MGNNGKDIIANIDLTISEICKWIQSQLTSSELYPVDAIKALTELISARTLMGKEYYSFSDSSNE